jgi:hypothetical protein
VSPCSLTLLMVWWPTTNFHVAVDFLRASSKSYKYNCINFRTVSMLQCQNCHFSQPLKSYKIYTIPYCVIKHAGIVMSMSDICYCPKYPSLKFSCSKSSYCRVILGISIVRICIFMYNKNMM